MGTFAWMCIEKYLRKGLLENWSGFQRESSKKRINAGSGLGSSLESSESNKEEKEKAEILQT